MNLEAWMLDVRTIALATSVSGFLMAATMIGIHRAGMRSRALIDWFAAGMLFGFGFLSGHVLQTLAVPVPGWFGAAVVNTLIAAGHAMVLVGVQRYLGVKPWTMGLLLIILAMFVTGMLFEPLRESLRARVIVHSVFYIAVDAWAGWCLWRAHRPGMEPFHRMAASVLFGFSAFLFMRFIYALVSPGLRDSFVQDPVQMLTFLAAMVFGFFLAMALAVVMFREKQLELMDLAEKDPLTGMHNRLSLDEIATRYREHASHRARSLSVMLFDIDHFKRVNDEFGHQTGDQVLTGVARRIDTVIRGDDVAFRFGGEEFLALLPGADEAQAMQIAERLRGVIGDEPFEIDGQQLYLTASFGVVEWQVDNESWDECVRRVDRALYRAKRGGRDRVARLSSGALLIPL